MAKAIVKEDVSKIENLIAKVVGYDGKCEIERMGGLTNHSYKVRLDDNRQYSVRIPGDGTEDMINRGDEEVSTRLACSLEIDAELLYFGQDGSKVTEYIKNAETLTPETMQKEKNILSAARILRKLHNCGTDTGVPFEVFDMAKDYERIINKNNVAQFDDYDQVRAEVMMIKKEIDENCRPVKVPCHNDPLCANWVRSDDKLYLIDWEYAGMNDGLWDLADVSIEAELSKEQDEMFLKAYLGCEDLDSRLWKHFTANKIYVDFLWTLWAKTRVPFDGQEMEDWAAERYNRLKGNVAVYKSMEKAW